MARHKPKTSADARPQTPPPDVCPQCGGVGFYVDDASNTTHRCDCSTETLAYRLRAGTSGIPAMFRDANFDNFEVPRGDTARQKILETARSFAESLTLEDPEGLVLRGEPGTGKTHIAVAILRTVMRRGMRVCYRGFNDLLTEIRHSYNPEYPLSEEEVLRPLWLADVLVLDDLGSETPKDFVRDRLYLIINRRYEARKPLIITTNCDSAELEARVGRRVHSRLIEMCSIPFPPFPADDWRHRKAGHHDSARTGKEIKAMDPRIRRMS